MGVQTVDKAYGYSTAAVLSKSNYGLVNDTHCVVSILIPLSHCSLSLACKVASSFILLLSHDENNLSSASSIVITGLIYASYRNYLNDFGRLLPSFQLENEVVQVLSHRSSNMLARRVKLRGAGSLWAPY